VTWINPNGGDWDTAANWSDDQGVHRLPGPADDAVINFAGITVTHSSFFMTDSVNSLTSAATVAISGGTLTLATASDVPALSFSDGTLNGAGNLTIDGDLTWTGGGMSGIGHTILNGTATVGGSVFGALLDGRTVDNAGTAAFSDGASVRFANNAVWNNEAGATLTLRGSATLGNFFGQTGQLSNAGLVIRSGAGSSTSTINIPFDNTGTVNVQTGTLSVSQGLTNEGELDVGVGAIASLSGTSSSGTLNVAADGQISIVANFEQSGTTSLAAGSVLNVGAGFNGGTDTIRDGATVSGPGTVVVGNGFGGGSLNVTGGASIANLSVNGGSVSVTVNGSLEVQNLTETGGNVAGPGKVMVDGSLNWTGGSMSGTGHTVLNGTATVNGGFFGPTLDGRTLDNAGTATVPDGANLLFSNNAVWNNEGGATLTLRGSATLGSFFGQSGQLSNGGLVVRSGTGNSTSTINIPFDNTGTVDVRTGTLGAAQALTNEGEFDIEAGATANLAGRSSGTVNVAADGQMNIVGDFEQSGSVSLAAGGTVNVGAGFSNGIYTLRDGATVNGPGTVLVSGSFFGGGLNVTGSGGNIDNLSDSNGSVSVAVNGTLVVQNLALSGGTVTLAANGNLDALNLNQTGGTLTGAGTATVTVLTWTNGTMSGTGHTVVNGTATVGGGVFGPTLDTRTLDNAGNATVPDGATLLFANNALWNNEDGAILVLQGSASLGNFFGQSGRLSNAGLVQTTGSGQATINFAVTNSGTLDLQGILVINGNYTQTASGTLNIHIGGTTAGTQYDQLQVHGLAALAGTLNVGLINGFTPVAGNNFRILTFNSRSGDFAAKNVPDLGSDLFIDPVYDASGLTLFTRSR
jgi:hypothetical protein